ncbi:hypothetical protein CC1G_09322 [Coprinopsis cinerea okayama7|uniref:Uncharacterized protein n=1 Tax=Coprinopsis cinerea (strain Okayama-7 / 130 / ATCC MYA-4618 / FGSC 9003) TaxID=240176 RepID=A8N5L7_COPC7|nr:hypothetical protein CC1G_09322 [Coprinopsis cinerea okayama7\|eukprot:XP_001830162.2 hypothetical protein CC1G_09322 [Coprinopsis cinerea okayama7\
MQKQRDVEVQRQATLGLIRRTKNLDKAGNNGALRRNTLQRLMVLSQSPHPELKILAAQNIPIYFSDDPEQGEQAINAIYDLCEDQSSQVRIEGYKAISEISRLDNRLLKRNADVLLQLLQSDEPEEVVVVKKALVNHVKMGPEVTLGVLCDQLSTVEEGLDEEEKAIRERLRKLVCNFLQEDMGSLIESDGTNQGDDLEEVILRSFREVVPKLEIPTIERIVKDLVLKLPIFQSPSDRGKPLVDALLERALLELRSAGKPSLSTAKPLLKLAQDLVIVHRVSPPLSLLQLYCNSLTGRVFLQQLSRDERPWIVLSLAELLSFCHQNASGDQDVLQHQWKIVDATPFLLETMLTYISTRKYSSTCITLLRNCLYRQKSQQWNITPILRTALEKLRFMVMEAIPAGDENKRELQKLLLFLMPSDAVKGIAPPPKTRTPEIVAPAPILAAAQTGPRRAALQIPHSRPSSSAGPSRPSYGESRPTSALSSKKRKSIGDLCEPPAKKSLLNRLQSNTPEPFMASAPQPQGLSIKGAASKSDATSNPSSSISPQPPKSGGGSSNSLLARLQGMDATFSSSPLSESSGSTSESRQRRRKKR